MENGAGRQSLDIFFVLFYFDFWFLEFGPNCAELRDYFLLYTQTILDVKDHFVQGILLSSLLLLHLIYFFYGERCLSFA